MKNKKVLVTGSSGFIGSHLADYLENNGNEVVLLIAIHQNIGLISKKNLLETF